MRPDRSFGHQQPIATRLRFRAEQVRRLWPALADPAVAKPRPQPRGAAKGLPSRNQVIAEAVDYFNEEGWSDVKEIADWISNRAVEIRDGGIDKRTAMTWAKQAAEMVCKLRRA
jgi:hypothetical protein